MDDRGRRLALHAVVSQNQDLGPERGEAPSHSRGGGASAELSLYSNLKEDIILTFKSTQKLQHVEDQNRTAATFLLEISLRGAKAQEVYESFETLINSSLTGLIGMSIKKESMVRKPAAAHLAQMVFGR